MVAPKGGWSHIKIGIVLPTRGLVFSQVLEAIEKERQGYEVKLYCSSDLVIPDGHNSLTKQALADGCDYIWFIEEDTVPPASSLAKLLEASSDISCIDYGVAGWGCVTKGPKGEIFWCGLGCTLVKGEVFTKLEYPWFRSDMTLRLNDWTWQKLPESYVKTNGYGGLDIWFCCKAREKGFKIVQVEGECDHLRLVALGQRETNNGLHQIELKERITKKQVL